MIPDATARPAARGRDRASIRGPRVWARIARNRAVRDGFTVVGLLYAAAYWAQDWGPAGFDAWAYWSVNPADPYAGADVLLGAFRYSPAAATTFGWLAALVPWPVFFWLLFMASLGALAWMGRAWFVVLLACPWIAMELRIGNIDLLLAAAVVAGLRWPALWAFPLLTKVGPGVGVLWFAFRREWRSLAIALGCTAAIAGVSFLATPGQWSDWVAASLRVNGNEHEAGAFVPIRLVAAVLLLAWAAPRNHRWAVPVAAVLGMTWLDPKTATVGLGLVVFVRETLERYRPYFDVRYASTAAHRELPRTLSSIGPRRCHRRATPILALRSLSREAMLLERLGVRIRAIGKTVVGQHPLDVDRSAAKVRGANLSARLRSRLSRRPLDQDGPAAAVSDDDLEVVAADALPVHLRLG